MKKLFRTVLCAMLLAALACVPAFAARETPPEKQGAFYVLTNGEYVTFTDAVPQIRNDRSCLPFVAVFDQLGFAEKDMTWDGATSTVTASKDGLTIALTIGKAEITLTRDGKTTTIPTDVAPYVDAATSRTYVPFGLVADALGYNVGWDGQLGAVIIDDVDAILAANTASYTWMERYMEYARSFNQKDQQVSGKYAMDISLKDEGNSFGMNADGDYSAVVSGSTAMQFATDLKLDITASEKAALEEMLEGSGVEFPLALDLDMRGDLETGVFYFQSAAAARLMDQPGMANAWYKIDLSAVYDRMGMDISELLQLSAKAQEMTFEESLELALRMFRTTDADYTASDCLADLNAIFADSAFTKSGDSYVSTLNRDGAAVIFTLYTNNSKVNGYAIQASARNTELGGIEVTASMRNTKMEARMDMDLDMAPAGAVSISVTIDGEYRTASAAPATEPPAGAVIIDLLQGI